MDLAKKSSLRLEQGHVRISRLLVHKGYTKLESAGVEGDEEEQSSWTRSKAVSRSSGAEKKRRPKWRFRVRPPRVRPLYSTFSSLVRRLRDSCARLMLALAAKARDSSLLFPVVCKKLTRTASAIAGASSSSSSTRSKEAYQLTPVEQKYLDYVRRSVADGELAYYVTCLKSTSLF